MKSCACSKRFAAGENPGRRRRRRRRRTEERRDVGNSFRSPLRYATRGTRPGYFYTQCRLKSRLATRRTFVFPYFEEARVNCNSARVLIWQLQQALAAAWCSRLLNMSRCASCLIEKNIWSVGCGISLECWSSAVIKYNRVMWNKIKKNTLQIYMCKKWLQCMIGFLYKNNTLYSLFSLFCIQKWICTFIWSNSFLRKTNHTHLLQSLFTELNSDCIERQAVSLNDNRFAIQTVEY